MRQRLRRRRTGSPTTTEAPPTGVGADEAADEALDDEAEHGPLRRCAVTRERLAKEQMIRFVVAPDHSVVPDVAARLPGRGIWLSARGDVIETARTRGGFARASRMTVTVPPDLKLQVAAALTRRLAEHLGLARRAGQAVAGFAKAREWLASGRAALVLQARDGSPDERQRFLSGWSGPVVLSLDAPLLGSVFGRDQAVHVAVAAGRLAEVLRCDAGRLAGVMPNGLPEVPDGSPEVMDDAGATGAAKDRVLGDRPGRRKSAALPTDCCLESPAGAAGGHDGQDAGG